jgi:protein-tyrosine phosphatase
LTKTRTSTASGRTLAWEGLFNARDLGGLPTAGGGRIRWGALVRSDLLPRLTPAGQQALVDHGVRILIDVRFPEEVAQDWDAYPFQSVATGEDRPIYLNVPFNTGREPNRRAEIKAAYAAAQSREELNRVDIDANQTGIAAIATAIARAPDGGVLVHCHGGKDRTGVIVALLLSLVGVTDDVIADDYALTNANLAPIIAEWLDRMSSEPAERERLVRLATPSREAMLDTLLHVRTRYGGAESYLRNGGVVHDDIERLKDRLVERPALPDGGHLPPR